MRMDTWLHGVRSRSHITTSCCVTQVHLNICVSVFIKWFFAALRPVARSQSNLPLHLPRRFSAPFGKLIPFVFEDIIALPVWGPATVDFLTRSLRQRPLAVETKQSISTDLLLALVSRYNYSITFFLKPPQKWTSRTMETRLRLTWLQEVSIRMRLIICNFNLPRW